jgi:UDP-glucose 4-epimerase
VNILVTGATGFLGRHLVRRLKDQPGYHTVTGVSRRGDQRNWEHGGGPTGAFRYTERSVDLTDPDEVEEMMSAVRPEAVFHLAGSPLTKTDPDNRFGPFADNVEVTHHLLEYAPKDCRFVFASSATVYGDLPYRCTCFTESSPLNPASVYGASKVAGEALVRAYTAQGRVRGVSLRLIANTGAWATHGLVRDLVRKAKSAEPTLCLLGDAPGSVKPLAYAGDTADAMAVMGLEHTFTGALNVGPNDFLSVEDVARVVLDTLGIDKPLSWAGAAANWKGDNPLVRIDNFAARTLGVWNPTYPTTAEACRQAVKELEALGC